MGIQDLRHALEAFARFLPSLETTSFNPSRNRLFANHSGKSSAGYGRSDFAVGQVDADILAEDELASYLWNTLILRHSNRLPDESSEVEPPLKKVARLSFLTSEEKDSHSWSQEGTALTLKHNNRANLRLLGVK
jgi:hypothetical protein